MLVFIDDSGDPGFKLEKGSSPVSEDNRYLKRLKDDGKVEDVWEFK